MQQERHNQKRGGIEFEYLRQHKDEENMPDQFICRGACACGATWFESVTTPQVLYQVE